MFLGHPIASAAVLIFLFLPATLVSGASLVQDEVEVLKEIAKTLGKSDWNFSVDPCSGEYNWRNETAPKEFANNVTCDCSFDSNTTCRVISIELKSQSLPGTLPPELVKLRYLNLFDVCRNYLSGEIPPIWGTMQLVKICLNTNRLSGRIPREIGNISTLESLTIDFNQFSGPIPPELGNLSSLQRLTLTSNYWSGELPETLAKLTNLTLFRIGDSNFTGRIPNFIQNWRNIENLGIQGSGLSGPIPPGIAFLTNLTDLRITDLNGNDTIPFPPLKGAKKMKTLMLRSCNINGTIPDYLATSFTNLKVLDLSFNKLSGPIPSNFEPVKNASFIYLTGNNLNGSIPDWIMNKADNIDLSYNNFSVGDSGAPRCKAGNLNLFASSSKRNTSLTFTCLENFSCPKEWYSLYINCGGSNVNVGGASYEDDSEPGGPSKLYRSSSSNWAWSNTGHFTDDDHNLDLYTSTSRISAKGDELYADARLSPLSLTYYGFCMRNGNYTVGLHFAEIKFTNDRTYSSLGRRIFDIYIQGNLVRKNFNIKDEAGGDNNKPIYKDFLAQVTENTLEIRFYWAGKGTTDVPQKGVYGPLISAISVNPNFPTPQHGLPVGAIVGIVLAVLFAISLVLVFLFWKCHERYRKPLEQDIRCIDLQTGSFTLRQISSATNNFDAANKIGEGGFGPVYKGTLSDGTIIAVKQLSSKSHQGNREFLNEVGVISAINHPNLVKLYGCCIEGHQLMLVYEYMENNSLARGLFGPEEFRLKLDWPTRHKICVGIARGLAYLHEESRLKIIHRDIKATNVLLDKEINPKISDFGLAKLHGEEDTHISTRIAGTFGYMAPEYAMRGYLTDKADVYSFGVVVLEIVSGKSNASIKPKVDCFDLLDWARLLKEEGKLMELIDSRMGGDLKEDEVMLTIEIALLCTEITPTTRPSMSTVVSMLEGRVIDEDFNESSNDFNAKMKQKENMDQQHLLANMDERQMSIDDMPLCSSSTSAVDLYPVNLDTDFLEKRL